MIEDEFQVEEMTNCLEKHTPLVSSILMLPIVLPRLERLKSTGLRHPLDNRLLLDATRMSHPSHSDDVQRLHGRICLHDSHYHVSFCIYAHSFCNSRHGDAAQPQ